VQAQNAEQIGHLTQQAADEKMDAVFVAGGDGTVNRAVSGLIGSQTALAVLPTGTANVWAKELGLPVLNWGNWLALEESARRLVNGVTRVVDVGLCAGTPFLLWASVGLDARVVHQLEPRKRWEKYFAVPKYAAATVREAYSWPGMELYIKVENETIHGQYLLAVVTNIHLYAGGLAELSPEARMDDGKMDLWLFSGDTLAAAVHHMLALWAGEHINSDQTRRIPFQNLRLVSDTPMYVQVDGEPSEGSEQIDICVKSNALRILIPQNTPQQLFSEI
ncbi:MAG: diacylglycerol kinase family protein, partial [Chloroflexota bacterium]|nr:diacylglycerol kinase family protein [Chloroflexota bacterium]